MGACHKVLWFGQIIAIFQGVLPLTFLNPADYDKVGEADRVSVRGLRDLAPGKPLEVALHHEDGSSDTVGVSHTLNADQVEWFKAGSALNILREG